MRNESTGVEYPAPRIGGATATLLLALMILVPGWVLSRFTLAGMLAFPALLIRGESCGWLSPFSQCHASPGHPALICRARDALGVDYDHWVELGGQRASPFRERSRRDRRKPSVSELLGHGDCCARLVFNESVRVTSSFAAAAIFVLLVPVSRSGNRRLHARALGDSASARALAQPRAPRKVSLRLIPVQKRVLAVRQ